MARAIFSMDDDLSNKNYRRDIYTYKYRRVG
jgi:hypothetical protein